MHLPLSVMFLLGFVFQQSGSFGFSFLFYVVVKINEDISKVCAKHQSI